MKLRGHPGHRAAARRGGGTDGIGPYSLEWRPRSKRLDTDTLWGKKKKLPMGVTTGSGNAPEEF